MRSARGVRWGLMLIGLTCSCRGDSRGGVDAPIRRDGHGRIRLRQPAQRRRLESGARPGAHSGREGAEGPGQDHLGRKRSLREADAGRLEPDGGEEVRRSSTRRQLASRSPTSARLIRRSSAPRRTRQIGPQPKNQSNFYVAHWQGSYLAGVAAGLLSKKGVVGYIAPFKVPTVNASINSFALGCQSVKKNCTVKTVLTSSWYDPPKETEAAQTLVNGGVDIMYGLTDDPAYGTVAAKNNMWTIGSYQYANVAAGKWYVTGVLWDWTKIYTDFLRGVAAKTWKSRTYVTGLGVGSGIAAWGTDVPANVKSRVEKVRSQMTQGMNPFKGPSVRPERQAACQEGPGAVRGHACLTAGLGWSRESRVARARAHAAGAHKPPLPRLRRICCPTQSSSSTTSPSVSTRSSLSPAWTST